MPQNLPKITRLRHYESTCWQGMAQTKLNREGLDTGAAYSSADSGQTELMQFYLRLDTLAQQLQQTNQNGSGPTIERRLMHFI